MYQLQPSYKKLLGSSVKVLLLTLMLMSSALAYSQTVTIGGSVFGGGDHGKVLTDSEITINDAHVMGDVYGGGNQGDLGGFYKYRANAFPGLALAQRHYKEVDITNQKRAIN